MDKIKIILVDDHDIVMDGIASLLAEEQAFCVAGKASSIRMAIELIEKKMPHLVLTDISMANESGLQLTEHITRHHPLVNVIVLSMHDDAQHIHAMLQAGARGYLLKNVKKDELLKAIHTVMNGEQYIQHSLVPLLTREQKNTATTNVSALSPREKEIVALVAQGHTTATISKTLFLSEHTIDTHRKNIGRKTGAKTALALLHYAKEHGLLR